jgi:DNA-binding transcriptional ArsR family regulator
MPPKSSNSEAQSLNNLCTLFHLLSDKTRLQIVMMLAEGERDVTSLCKELHLAQPTVSHHLGLLRMNRVIMNKRQGKRVIYTLDNTAGRATGGKLKFMPSPYSVVVEGF